MQFLVKRFVPLSSKFKMIPVFISEKASKPEKVGFFSNFTTHKTFIRSQLYYAGVIHDQTYKPPFHDKLESFQYNACLAIKGAIR